MKVVSWTPAQASDILRRRLEAAKKNRENFEAQWRANFQLINNADSKTLSQSSISFNSLGEVGAGDQDQSSSSVGTNYAFKFLRFLHSQMSANPPSVSARPATTDSEDRRRADAADRIIRHAIKDKDINEIVDQATLKTLTYGIGWLKQIWNPDKGDVAQFDESTNEIIMEGDIELYSPDVGDIWMDPDARTMGEVRYIFERKLISQEEAIFLFPDNKDDIEAIVNQHQKQMGGMPQSKGQANYEPQVEIFEYYEKASPVNGMAGRFCRFLKSYKLLEPVRKNPHVNGMLPYYGLTYVDVPDQVYGKSVVEYVADIQDMLNRLDSSIVDNVQAHGVIRLLVPDSAEIEDEALSDSAWDWIKYSGNNAPKHMPSPSLMPDMWQIRNQLQNSIQELYGINDSQLGIQKREQSAVSQQTAIEQGTMIHRRLFKKYTGMVEKMFTDYLELVKENWTEPHTIQVLGKENAFEVADFKGSDIEGGYDIACDYGQSLPLDPNLRRESIMLLMPTLKEAGMSAKQILQYLKLNDLEGIQDRFQLAANRQREVFEEMIAKVDAGIPIEEAYIAPEELEEHAGRLEFAYTYVETVEFKYLSEDIKDLIRMHIREREKMMAQAAAPAPAPVPNEGIPLGMPGTGGAVAPGPLAGIV
jgi:hypothetical protein